MKILCFLLLLCALGPVEVHAGFVVAPSSRAYTIVADSPEVSQPPFLGRRRIKIVPEKQVHGVAVLSLATGLLSMTGAIALLALWPVTVWVGVALGVGALAAGVASIVLAFYDGANLRPHPVLSVTGALLGFLAILPVLFPVSVLFSIIFLISDLAKRKRKKTSTSTKASGT